MGPAAYFFVVAGVVLGTAHVLRASKFGLGVFPRVGRGIYDRWRMLHSYSCLTLFCLSLARMLPALSVKSRLAYTAISKYLESSVSLRL